MIDDIIYPPQPVKHFVSVSSGAPSALLALKVVEKYGAENVHCVFADTLVEHNDNYRFLYDLQYKHGLEIIFINHGKTPEELQIEQKTLFTQALAPCTRILKLEPIRKHVLWLQQQGFVVVMHIGMTVEDSRDNRGGRINGRLDAPTANWYSVWCKPEFMLVDEGYTRGQVQEELKQRNIQIPLTYSWGLPNANCVAQGGCVKGGKSYMQKILESYPEGYLRRETIEEQIIELRQLKGLKPFHHLREKGGSITLKEFRLRFETEDRKIFTLENDMDGLCGAECGVSSPEVWKELEYA